jgi:ferrous iron transport protein A
LYRKCATFYNFTFYVDAMQTSNSDRKVSPCTLDELTPGEEGKIHELIPVTQNAHTQNFEASVGKRLLELGFLPGEHVVAVKKAPLCGDPKSFLVRGMHIALRRDEAKLIQVIRI